MNKHFKLWIYSIFLHTCVGMSYGAVLFKNTPKTTVKIKEFSPTFAFTVDLQIKQKSYQNLYQEALELFDQGSSEESLKLALKALELIKKEKDFVYLEKSSFLIGKIFEKSTDYGKALIYFTKALDYARELNNIERIVENELHVGTTYHFSDKLDFAKKFYEKVIAVQDTTSSILTMQAKAYSNLSGIFFSETANFKKAKEYALKAIVIHRKQGSTLLEAYAYTNLASNLTSKKEYTKVKEYFLKALQLIADKKDYDAIRLQRDLYGNLEWIYHLLEDYKQSYDYQRRYMVLKDSLQKASHRKELLEIDAKYNVAISNKEKEKAQRLNYFLGILSFVLLVSFLLFYRNSKLKQKNREKELENKRQNNVLNATLDKKEALEKKITEALHDSTIQYLGAANMYLGTVKRDKDQETIAETKKIIEKASKSLYAISNDLVSLPLLNFGLPTAIEELCEGYSTETLAINSASKNIARYDTNFEIKVYNIIHELLKNTVAHSHASKGMIALEEKDDFLIIRAIDDGKGFEADELKEQSGIGLAQIEARIKKMKGTFKIHSASGDGTNISISIPIVALSNEETFENLFS